MNRVVWRIGTYGMGVIVYRFARKLLLCNVSLATGEKWKRWAVILTHLLSYSKTFSVLSWKFTFPHFYPFSIKGKSILIQFPSENYYPTRRARETLFPPASIDPTFHDRFRKLAKIISNVSVLFFFFFVSSRRMLPGFTGNQLRFPRASPISLYLNIF